LGLALGSVGVTWAHPGLVRSEPAASSTLEQAPRQVSVWFDEAIEPDYGNLSVFDGQGRRVDNLDTRFLPGAQPGLTTSLPELPKGSYVVVWRVVSVGDGHAVGDAFSFGIGVPPDLGAAAAAGAQADVPLDWTAHLIRFLGLLAPLVLVGAVTFRGLVWGPALRLARQAGALRAEDERRLAAEQRRYLTVLADTLVAALVIGVLGALYVQARATGVLFWQVLATRWGVLWSVHAAAALLAAIWLEGLLDGRRPAWLAWSLVLALLATTTLTSHSSAKPGLLGPLADFVHQLSAGVWLGGLASLVFALLAVRLAGLEADLANRLRGEWMARFSGLAAASVGLVLASGLVLGWQQVGNWSGLVLSQYGQTLLVKLLVAAVALAFGAYNALATPRRAVAGNGGRSPLWIALESGAVMGVVFVAAVVTDLPPAIAKQAAGLAPGQSAQVLVLPARSPELLVTAQLQPARLGSNVFEVSAAHRDGEPVRGAKVELFFEPVGGGALSSTLALGESPAGDGRYRASGDGLTRAGPWQVLVTIREPGTATAEYANFDLDIGPDQVVRPKDAPLPLPARALTWLNRFGRLGLGVLALGVLTGWVWIAGRSLAGLRRVAWLAAGLLAAGLIWVALIGLSL
jgi:copper transport protein